MRLTAERRRPATAYAWVILAVGFVVSALVTGISTSFGVFFIPLSDAFEWSASTISFAYSLFMLTYGLSSFGAGRLGDQYGSRRIFFLGGALFGLALVLMSRMSAGWHLYVLYGLLAGVARGPLNVTLLAMVSRWFSTHRGFALGLVNSGTGVGSSLLTPLASSLILTVGWQDAYVVLGVMVWVLLSAAVLLLRDDPRDLGLLPYGDDDAEPPRSEASAAGTGSDNGREWDLRDAMRTAPFWTLGVLHFWCCVCHSIPLLHIVPSAIRGGLSPTTAASVLAAIGVASFFGKIGWGIVADRRGPKAAYVMAAFMRSVMTAWLLVSHDRLAFFGFAVLWGLGFGGTIPPYALLVKDYYGAKSFGALYGAIMVCASLGMASGAYGAGLLFDLTGSYQPAWVLSLVTGMLTGFLALRLEPPRHRRPREERDVQEAHARS